jgi:glucose/arabinose dehydrogenase
MPQPGLPVEGREPNGAYQHPAFPQQTRAPFMPSTVALQVGTIAEGLEDAWSMAFLPDGRLLVTERNGWLRIIADGKLSPPVGGLPVSLRRKIESGAETLMTLSADAFALT